MIRKRKLMIWLIVIFLILFAGQMVYADEVIVEETPVEEIAAPKKMVLSSTTVTYTGEARKPAVTVYDVNGDIIDKKNYSLTYASGCVNVGQYKVTATFKGNYSGSLSAHFKIIPKKPGSLTLSTDANAITAKWSKVTSQITGYQIMYSRSSTFSSGNTWTKKIPGSRKNSYKIKDLSVDVTYYLKVRTYKNVGDKVYCSKWGPTKKIKVKQHAESLNAKSAIIMEAGTKKVYFKKDISAKRANASTTKIMTAILALENKKLDSKVKITKEAANVAWSNLGSSVVGDTIRMKDLLYMLLLPSDNGAANALAIHTSGSVSSFVKKMNKKASSLGLTSTKFKNPHGLDASGHYSSARDMAVLADYCMKNKTFAKIVKTRSYSFSSVNKGIRYHASTKNLLLGQVKGLVGLKTGSEVNAGYCFIGAYKHGGKMYFTVVFGCSSEENRWSDTRKLIRYIDKYL